jgi:integrase/recombinase XerD
MVRPAGRPMARKEITLEDLREEFLAHYESRNLSGRTVQWYNDRTRRFVDWCATQGIGYPSDLGLSDLERFVLECRRRGFAPNTVRGYAQVLKTLCRLGHRLGYIPEDITGYFEMPRVPKAIIPTFSDEQLQALLAVPDKRTWLGIRDRAILLVLLDTLIRVSELVGVDAEDVGLDDGLIRVMGKGGNERRVPIGMAAGQALRRYRNVVQDLRPGDPFFITRYGHRISRWAVHMMMANSGRAAGIEGVRCSPHTLRHTGAKRFILAGGDVFTLQKLLGHRVVPPACARARVEDRSATRRHRCRPWDATPGRSRRLRQVRSGLLHRSRRPNRWVGPPAGGVLELSRLARHTLPARLRLHSQRPHRPSRTHLRRRQARDRRRGRSGLQGGLRLNRSGCPLTLPKQHHRSPTRTTSCLGSRWCPTGRR